MRNMRLITVVCCSFVKNKKQCVTFFGIKSYYYFYYLLVYSHKHKKQILHEYSYDDLNKLYFDNEKKQTKQIRICECLFS